METSRHPKLDSDNIDALTEAIEIAVPPSCAMFTHECGGAASCVAVDAMSIGLLRDQLLVQILTTAPDWLDQLEEPRVDGGPDRGAHRARRPFPLPVSRFLTA